MCPLAFLCLELKDGRIPQGLSSRLGYWKTEEFQKFSYPVSELLLAGLLEPMEYHLWQLTARMTELIFNKRNGWSLDDRLLFQNLAKRYIILNEEHRGLTACRITVHNLQHIAEDAYQFSHPDNYWCFPYERAVKRYVSISSNFKNMECSFAKREGYRELLKLLRGRIQPQEETNFKFDLEKASIYMHSLLFTITYMHIISCEVGSSKIKEAGYLAGGWHLMRTENRMCMCTFPLISSLILLKLNHQALSTADFLHFVLHHNQILLNFLFFNCCYCFFFFRCVPNPWKVPNISRKC